MKIITILSNKGGNGKTTLALNIAVELSKNARVLFIDSDPQANSTDVLLNDEEPGSTLFDSIKANKPPEIYDTQYENVDLIASGRDLDFTHLPTNLDKYGEIIEHIGKDYDFCIIDTPAELNRLSCFFIYFGSYYMIISRADRFSYKGAVKALEVLDNAPGFLGVLLNFCKQYKTNKNQIKEFKESGLKCFNTELQDYADYSNGINEYKLPITDHYPKSKAAKGFTQFYQELLTKIAK